MNPATPVSLLQRIAGSGDAEAWERFVRLYTPVLYHWVRRTGLQEADAADLVQEVFEVLVRRLPSFRYDATRSFHRWLYTVLRNRWRDHLRRRAAASASRGSAPTEPAMPDAVANWIDEDFRAHLVRRALRIMQCDFQPATWRACWEVVVAGRPTTEVAAELGLTVGAVHAARFRVLGRLRRELEGLLD
jgi:RNA polymerase sigma-70 factor (ECF subfamily)